MHNVTIRQHIVDRVVARRGDIHWFTELDPRTSALVIVDMQNTFCLPGAPGEVPEAREIVPAINDLAARMRDLGVPVIWVLHTNSQSDGVSDWEVFFNHVVRNPDVKKRCFSHYFEIKNRQELEEFLSINQFYYSNVAAQILERVIIQKGN